MIIQGVNGSVCFYFKGTLISGYPLSKKKTVEYYLYQGERMIRSWIRCSKTHNIKEHIISYFEYCNLIRREKLNGGRINSTSHMLFISSLCALMRLRLIENDDDNGYLVCKRK